MRIGDFPPGWETRVWEDANYLDCDAADYGSSETAHADSAQFAHVSARWTASSSVIVFESPEDAADAVEFVESERFRHCFSDWAQDVVRPGIVLDRVEFSSIPAPRRGDGGTAMRAHLIVNIDGVTRRGYVDLHWMMAGRVLAGVFVSGMEDAPLDEPTTTGLIERVASRMARYHS